MRGYRTAGTGWKRLLCLLFACFLSQPVLADAGERMALIPSGTYSDFLAGTNATPTQVSAFYLDRTPVTVQDFARFLDANPQWHPDATARIFADERYLDGFDEKQPTAPVVSVSWFSARAYCHWRRARLPTTAEWEYAAAAPDAAHPEESRADFSRRILDWYASPAMEEATVGSTFKNRFGVYDMHGLIWEWVEDFNRATVVGDGRSTADQDQALYCGGASANARDPSEYATFMRYALRSSLRAASTAPNLGFRCARGVER